MGSSSGISCCCKNTKFLCCLTLDAETTCPTATPSDCKVTPGEPQVISHTLKGQKWVNSEEECNCDGVGLGGMGGDGSGGGGFGGTYCGEGGGCEGGTRIISCSATFYGGITQEDHEEANKVCSTADKVCTTLACGPCGLYASGCTLVGPDEECPPPPPGCTPQECCDPTPGALCCCRTIQGCITDATCGACEGMSCNGPNQYKSVVASCDVCIGDGGAPCVFVTALCVTTENYSCCDDPPGCTPTKCVCPCGTDNGPPLCNCVINVSEGCAGPTEPAGYGVNYANLYYGSNLNSAENRYTSGIIVDSNGVSQLNTLLLFGYGYKNL